MEHLWCSCKKEQIGNFKARELLGILVLNWYIKWSISLMFTGFTPFHVRKQHIYGLTKWGLSLFYFSQTISNLQNSITAIILTLLEVHCPLLPLLYIFKFIETCSLAKESLSVRIYTLLKSKQIQIIQQVALLFFSTFYYDRNSL